MLVLLGVAGSGALAAAMVGAAGGILWIGGMVFFGIGALLAAPIYTDVRYSQFGCLQGRQLSRDGRLQRPDRYSGWSSLVSKSGDVQECRSRTTTSTVRQTVAKATKSNDREIGELSSSVGDLKWLFKTIVGFMIALAGGGAALYHQVTQLRSELEIVERDVGDVLARIKALQSQSDKTAAANAPVMDTLRRIESRLAVAPLTPGATILSLTPSDTDFLKVALWPEVTKWLDFVDGRYAPGDPIKTPNLKPVPDEVWQKLPSVKGLQFTVDDKRNILLVSSQGTRVLAVIPPD